MTNQHLRLARVALAAFGLMLTAAASATSAEIDVRSTLPVSCGASVVTSQVVTITPLLVNASIHQACNTRHDLTVTYQPKTVIHPNRLFVTFDGQPPNVRATGNEIFTNIVHTDSTKPLVIRYSGGTVLQRQILSQTWAITVTPR